MAFARKSSVRGERDEHGGSSTEGPRPRDLARARLRLRGGNRVELFDSGRAVFPAMLDAIASAEESVDLEVYLLGTGAVGQRFRDALADRARRGVEVRVVYDAVGSFGLDDAFLAPLRESGAQVRPFNPPWSWTGAWSPRRRNHRKLLVIDASVAFSGGLNLSEEYDAPARSEGSGDAWRDTHVRVDGPLVADYADVFEQTWVHTGAERRTPRKGAESDSSEPVRAAVLADGRRRANRRTDRFLSELIDGSRSSVRLTTPYFAPSRRMFRALRRAARRGVRVEILTAGETDHRLLRFGYHATVDRLLAVGVHAFEYAPAMMHAKSGVFDARIAVAGSSNLERQSLRHSFELNTVFDDAPVARRLDRMIEEDLAHAVRITAEGLEERNLLVRLRDRIAAIVVRFLL